MSDYLCFIIGLFIVIGILFAHDMWWNSPNRKPWPRYKEDDK